MSPAAQRVQFVRHYLLALQFFTRVPVTGRLAQWVGFSPAMLRASAAHFPGVGWLVAAVGSATTAAVWLALEGRTFGPLAAALAGTIATVLLTGAFHEDGLADVADGLGGSADHARSLEIMKDSRIGAFGALAMILALGFKVILLAVLGEKMQAPMLCALAGAHALSRFAPLVLVATLPHVGDTASSKSKPLADQIAPAALLYALLWCLPPLALVAWFQGPLFLLCACTASAVGLAWMWRLFSRRLQGFTGDCLGATQQVSEIAFYLGAAVSAGLA